MRFHACISNHMFMYNYMHACIYTHTYALSYSYSYTDTNTSIRPYINSCIHTYSIRTYMNYIHTSLHAYIHNIYSDGVQRHTDTDVQTCRQTGTCSFCIGSQYFLSDYMHICTHIDNARVCRALYSFKFIYMYIEIYI